jgi:hypothetical protein
MICGRIAKQEIRMLNHDIDLEKMKPEHREKFEKLQREIMGILSDVPFLKLTPAPYGLDVSTKKLGDE